MSIVKNNKHLLFQKIIAKNDMILMEAGVLEKLRRSKDITLHPTLANAPLIYDTKGKLALRDIYNGFIDIAKKNNTPIFLCTPTWRANYARVVDSEINSNINIDAAKFLNELRIFRSDFSNNIKIGGLIACRNDCYKPEEGLSIGESEKFHTWQIEQLVKGGVDFLIAQTLPMVNEAIGIAKAMEKSGIPYFISFVISRNGNILDGTSLSEAISKIDENTPVNPIGYMVNCAYPTFLCADTQNPELFERLIGYMANASSLDHCNLEGAKNLKADSLADWGNEILKLHRNFELKILGGCCGTGNEHLNYIVNNQYVL